MSSSESELSFKVAQKDVLKTNQHMKPLPLKKALSMFRDPMKFLKEKAASSMRMQ